MYILRFCCHFPFMFYMQRLFGHLQVNILPAAENVKRHTISYQRPIFDCSLQLWLTEMITSGAPRHLALSSTGWHFYQSELLGTVENTFFSNWWCGVCPILFKSMVQKWPS